MKGVRELRQRRLEASGGDASMPQRSNQEIHGGGGPRAGEQLPSMQLYRTSLTGQRVVVVARNKPLDFASRLRQCRLATEGDRAKQRNWPKFLSRHYAALSEAMGCKPNKVLSTALKAFSAKVRAPPIMVNELLVLSVCGGEWMSSACLCF